jgi:hypothetical protein
VRSRLTSNTDAPEGWPTCAALLPHAEAALNDDSPGMARLANYLGERGSYAAALELQQRVLAAKERVLGPGHPGTLATRNNPAYWTGAAGDAAAARDQFAALLPISERILGPDHPDTLTTRADLAHWKGESRSWPKLRSTAAQRLHPENSSPSTAPRYSNGHAFRRITGDLCGLPNSC